MGLVGRYWGAKERARFGGKGDRDVTIIIDGSASMTMQGDGKTNFERAVEEAGRVISSTPRKTSFALIVAGPSPNIRVPAPISDRKVLRAALDEAVPVYGTMHVLDALSAAGICLAQGYNPSKQIILFTDGAGRIQGTFPGGGGPLTIWGQFVMLDPTAVAGIAMSDAVQVSLLP